MPRPKKSYRLVAQAEAALISAIEVYNKPDFSYREETFSILALNAWELLLKAKLLAECHEDVRCLYVYDQRRKQDGSLMKGKFLRRNRTGNIFTLGLDRVITELEGTKQVPLGAAVRNNLAALTEVRDNAVHYYNASPHLAKQVLEFGTASVKNFIELAKRWFQRDLSQYNLYLMPIGFISVPSMASGLVLSQGEGNLISYLTGLVPSPDATEPEELFVSLQIDLSFRKSQGPGAVNILTSNDDPTATNVQLTEEDIRQQYPWDYKELTNRLNARYAGFKINSAFQDVRKSLLGDSRYAWRRYLDPGNPQSSQKLFYSSSILNEFDKHYSRK